MRVALALVIAASLPAVAATAQAFDALPDGVVRVDPAAVRVKALAEQQTCRAVATKAAGKPVMVLSASTAPPTALASSLASGGTLAVAPAGKYEKSIFECMAAEGYVPKPVESGDDAAYRRALAAGQHPDPYSLILRFTPTLSSITTVVDARDASGQQVTTYTVGRF